MLVSVSLFVAEAGSAIKLHHESLFSRLAGLAIAVTLAPILRRAWRGAVDELAAGVIGYGHA
jgi:hypothetical protein